MLQCSECEHFHREPDGRITFRCDPFSTIKESECLLKWQIVRLAEASAKLDRIVAAHEATAEMYRKLGPLQEKMFRYMEREIDSAEEADRWKSGEFDDEDDASFDDEEEDDRA